MTRFIIFGGQAYYAQGGAFDILDIVTSEADAIRIAASKYEDEQRYPKEIDWVHVFDTVTATVVYMQGEALGQFPIKLPQSVPIPYSAQFDD